MAVSVILNDLALRENNSKGKISWEKYRKVNLLYDVVIRIDSLEDLKTHGWEILLGKNTDKITPLEGATVNSRGVTVAVLGAYNRGKTFVLSQLCKILLPHSNLMHTEGISITAGKHNYSEIVFMDTAGTDTPVANNKVGYKRATEALLREVVVHLSSFIIIVVNRLRATDQIYIDKVIEHCKNRNDKKGIIIVHNLYDVESLQDLTNTITMEVEGIFGAKKHEKQFTVGGYMTSTSYYSSKLCDDFELTHFIMAKNGTPAGKLCNTQSLDGIMNMLQAATEQKASFNIISEMIKFMNMRLSQLFARQIPLIDDSTQENAQFAQQDDQNNVRIIQHDSHPYIVLANRKHLQNLEENPYPLDLSKKLVYDDAGYFIKNARGLWAPRHNLYDYGDSIHLVLELPGFGEGEVTCNLTETGCIVEGTREDLCSKRDATVRASEIPTGKFKLEISFEHPIDKRSAKAERRHGFIIITAVKKADDPTPIQV